MDGAISLVFVFCVYVSHPPLIVRLWLCSHQDEVFTKTLAGGLEEHLPCRRCDESVELELLFVVILIWMRPTMMLAAELNETLENS